MTHIQVFLFAKYGKILFDLPEEAILAAIRSATKLPLTDADYRAILACEPTKKQLVQGLADIGLNQAQISRLTGLKQPTVSYHLRTVSPKSYRNAFLDALAASYKMNLHK